MKVSSAWIKNWLRRTMLSDEQVVAALERSGMEIEDTLLLAAIDKKIVVGLVKEVVQHPGADRLHLVLVTTGSEDFRIVCGAPNVRAGIKVAFAQIGSVLPGGEKIARAKLRGEVSEGMLCSERELGLGRDHEGILELPEEAHVGASVQDLYLPDTIIDLKTPANRFDVLSVLGLAREVGAMLDEPLKPLEVSALPKPGTPPEVAGDALAERYLLAHFKVKTDEFSPQWLASRLQSVGVRSISPIVDITNFVMLDLGQPMHAYDAARVKLPIEVRKAHVGERLTTLDGVERKLTTNDLVIADAGGPIGLAGIMGGADTEVTAETREVLLEAAVFDAASVRKTAQRHRLRTEASARFERGLPVELPELAMARAQKLLQEITDAKLVSLSDQSTHESKQRTIALTKSQLEQLAGTSFTNNKIVHFLERLGIAVQIEGDHILIPEVPWWRPDLRLPEDIVEEVVRVLGYDQIPATLPAWRPQRVVFDRVRAKRRQIRDTLYAAGLFEVTTYAFIAEEQLTEAGLVPREHLKLKNPLSQEQAYLRSSLLPSHLAVLARNRTYARDVGFYEMSAVFLRRKAGDQPDEPLHLAVTNRREHGSLVHLKGILDGISRELNVEVEVRPEVLPGFVSGRSGALYVGDDRIGLIGQLHPERLGILKIGGEASHFELDVDRLLATSKPKQFRGLEKFPTIVRDVTIQVPAGLTWAEMRATALPQEVSYVGEYQGENMPAGYKSVTLRLVVARSDRTPTESEATEAEAAVRSRLVRKLGADSSN